MLLSTFTYIYHHPLCVLSHKAKGEKKYNSPQAKKEIRKLGFFVFRFHERTSTVVTVVPDVFLGGEMHVLMTLALSSTPKPQTTLKPV